MGVRCTSTTVSGESCRAWALHGTDPPTCPHHAGRRRPAKFNPETVERIVQLLAAGNYHETTASAVGISAKTFYQWLRRGAPDGHPNDIAYRDFRERVERAISEGEARNVALIARAASNDNWQAAAWLLERRHPERWARPSQRADKDAAPIPAGEADPFDTLDELAPRREARHAG